MANKKKRLPLSKHKDVVGKQRQSRATGKHSKPVARWKVVSGQRRLILENAFYQVELWPEFGGALLSYVDKPTGTDIIWKNPYVQPPRLHVLDQPMAGGSDLYDVMDGSWYVSVPNGYFACNYLGAPVGTHGELRAVPWEVEAIDTKTRGQLTVKLVGRSVRTPWVYKRELTVRATSARLQWKETLYNRSARTLPVTWLQHPTFGGPLLEGAKLLTPARTVRVFKADDPSQLQLEAGYEGKWPYVRERESRQMRDCSVVPPAGSGKDHSVQLTDFVAGQGCIWNEKKGFGFAMEWDLATYPYAWSWNSAGGVTGYPLWGEGHIITLQPSTSPVGRFDDLVKGGHVLHVAGGGEVSTVMTTGFTRTPQGPWQE